jgi:hypothetical protein
VSVSVLALNLCLCCREWWDLLTTIQCFDESNIYLFMTCLRLVQARGHKKVEAQDIGKISLDFIIYREGIE